MKTALITGASEGIGLELARLFAMDGINLVLVARNESRLQAIAKKLSSSSNSVRIYAKDLSVVGNATFIYDDLKAQGIAIDYLVNNAGVGINNQFVDTDWQQDLDMLNLNIITLTYFTKVFARDMKARRFGRILNVGSTGSFQPAPYMAAYCASKAFVLSLSEAVNHELKGTNVSVSTLCPGVTDTKFHDVAQTNHTLMEKLLPHSTPAPVAKYGYKIMMKGQSLGVHGGINKLLVFFNRLLCRRMIIAIAGKLMKK